METLQAKYTISAPMFLAGIQEKAELRPPSFKGVLRFWYRAIALNHYQNNLKEIKKQEDELFGSTKGQAKFLLRLQPASDMEYVPKKKWHNQYINYLGYGLNDRSYIKEGAGFTVTLQIKRKEHIDILKQALKAVGIFGGLGSRSRRGFGSISLETLQANNEFIWQVPRNTGQLIDCIKDFFKEIGPLANQLPEYSAFSRHSFAAVVATDITAMGLLSQVGEQMTAYRKDIRADAQLVKRVIQGDEPTDHPRRVIFGLPHNYFFKGMKLLNIQPREYIRRASPLFIHLHKLENQYAAVMLLLPAQFLPEGSHIKVGHKSVPSNIKEGDYRLLRDFISSFPNAKGVWPGE